jgi:hypothetical protein
MNDSNMYLKGKRVLLIAPKYFGYEREIIKEIENKGGDVTFVPENLEYFSTYHRMIYVYFKSHIEKDRINYYKKRIGLHNGKVDYVLIIRGSSVNEDVVQLIKQYNPDAKLIIYNWDSTDLNPNIVKIYMHFDRVLTFDNHDATKYGWIYRPLFFINDASTNLIHDICFIGSLHSERGVLYRKLKEISINEHIDGIFYLYTKKFYYFKQKYINRNPEYIVTDKKDINFRPLSLQETNKLYSSSKVVIDYTHPKQCGLTMRTIESLGHRCKLITNNKHIQDEVFFDPQNVLIYQGVDISIPKDFLQTEYKDISDEIVDKYSLEYWVREVLGI